MASQNQNQSRSPREEEADKISLTALTVAAIHGLTSGKLVEQMGAASVGRIGTMAAQIAKAAYKELLRDETKAET